MIREAHLWGSEVELHYPNGLSTPEANNLDLTGVARLYRAVTEGAKLSSG